jgi:ubiquinone/menaquinone biosynthesis C-methylase UbiE
MTIAWQASIANRQTTWAAGDFHQISAQQVIVGEWLCEAAAVHAGEHVLDVASGSGNAALAAARRHAEVTAVDFVPALLGRARLRAAAEGLRLQVDLGDAQALPYAERRFDVVVSTFGVMFAPNQQRAANEMLRVCRHGGRIALASWQPDSLLGEQFGIIVDFQGCPDPRPTPTRWGTEEGVHELLGRHAVSIRTRRRYAYASYRSIEHVLYVWTELYGPIVTLLGTLTPEDKAEFKRELAMLWSGRNEATDGSVMVHSSYLEAVITRD